MAKAGQNVAAVERRGSCPDIDCLPSKNGMWSAGIAKAATLDVLEAVSMKKIGISIPTIEGGVVCHQEIGREAARRGISYPEIITHTPLFDTIGQAASKGDFSMLASVLAASINSTARAGADFAIIPSNTVHFVFGEIAKQATIPVLSLPVVIANYCKAAGFSRVGILGTKPTMRDRLYDAALAAQAIEAVYPPDHMFDAVQDIILDELVKGVFRQESRTALIEVANLLGSTAQAVVLACTELPLVLESGDCSVPLIDTTRLLAHAALDYALN